MVDMSKVDKLARKFYEFLDSEEYTNHEVIAALEITKLTVTMASTRKYCQSHRLPGLVIP